MNELALFAGAGGGILGGKLLGWRTVCAGEWDAYARDVLVSRQNDGCLDPFPIWDDVQTFDGHPWRGIAQIITGGFPCQDISAAGKGAGITGERSGMWKHMARIIGEVLPQYVLVENSPMLVGRGLGTVLADLAEMGYDAEWGVVGAHHAGAPHKRDRIWIVADSKGWKNDRRTGRNMDDSLYGGKSGNAAAFSCRENVADTPDDRAGRRQQQPESSQVAGHVADPMCHGSQRERKIWATTGQAGLCGGTGGDEIEGIPHTPSGGQPMLGRTPGEGRHPLRDDLQAEGWERGCWWATEPDVGRVAHGVAARVDRLRCLGNGQVPAVVPLAWDAIL